MVGAKHDACGGGLVTVALLVGTFGALEGFATRREDALGAVDCDRLFRHIAQNQ
jgi:hypothetical protein